MPTEQQHRDLAAQAEGARMSMACAGLSAPLDFDPLPADQVEASVIAAIARQQEARRDEEVERDVLLVRLAIVVLVAAFGLAAAVVAFA